MEPISTISDAKAAGYTHLWVVCDACQRAKSILLDVVERRGSCRNFEALTGAFKCRRCGATAARVCLAERAQPIKEFEYIVVVWDDRRLDIDKVELAACCLKDAEPAFHAIAGRHPHRWVTLLSPTGIVLDSDRDVFGFDV